jgi:hypothetical protein
MFDCLELVYFPEGWFQDYQLEASTNLAAWIEIHIDRDKQYVDRALLMAGIKAAIKVIEPGDWWRATTDRYVRSLPTVKSAKTGQMIFQGMQVKVLEYRNSLDPPPITAQWGRIGDCKWCYLGGWTKI